MILDFEIDSFVFHLDSLDLSDKSSWIYWKLHLWKFEHLKSWMESTWPATSPKSHLESTSFATSLCSFPLFSSGYSKSMLESTSSATWLPKSQVESTWPATSPVAFWDSFSSRYLSRLWDRLHPSRSPSRLGDGLDLFAFLKHLSNMLVLFIYSNKFLLIIKTQSLVNLNYFEHCFQQEFL